MTENKLLAKLSKSLKTQIVTWISESTSDTCGFGYYANGALLREVLVTGGKVESKGSRLAAEGKVVWKDAGEDDLQHVVKGLGPAFDSLPKGINYRIYDLDETGQ